MAKKPDPSAVDALVTNALLTLATADAPRRLVGRGDHPALLSGKTGANKDALDRILDAAAPLVVTEGKARAEAARLTAAGFRTVLPHLPEDRVGPAAKALAGALPTAEKVAFLQDVVSRTPVASAELLPEYESAVAAEKAEAEARAKEAEARREREDRARQAMVRWIELGDERKRQRVEALLAELKAEGVAPPPADTAPPVPPPPATPNRGQAPKPQTREDADFRRDVAERLVSSWRDAAQMGKAEARQFLETALDNVVTLRRIGEEGDEVPFDGALHEAIPGVFTDHPVKVTRSGWALEEDADREYVIQKAQVAKP